MAPVTNLSAGIPDAPAHMSDKAKAQYQSTYSKALAQARLDYPDNEASQRRAALKAANALLAVPAPDSAAAIDKLDEWQVITRETRERKGVTTRVCVTTDGRKYAFPIPTPSPAKAAKAE